MSTAEVLRTHDAESPPNSSLSVALRPHQQQAFDGAAAHLDHGSRVTVVLPCGTGKTLLGQRLAYRQTALRRDPILVVVPTVALLAQTLKAWINHSPHNVAAFVFCHDATLGYGELQVPVSTSPAALANWVTRTHHGAHGPQPVVFATYQSSPRIADAHRNHFLPVWGAIVADEAHCCAGQFEAAFATVVDAGKVPARSRIFLTATPRVRKDNSSPAFCMDDPTSFGPIVAPLSVRAAIDAQLLSDYIVVVVAVSDDDVRAAITNPTSAISINGDDQSAERIAVQLAVAAAAHTYELRRIMVFHNSVADSKDFTASLPAVLAGRGPTADLTALHLDGATPAVQRAAHLDRLADPGPGRWTVLSNVRCLGQGVDVPALDGVVFAGPRTSALDITQCVGRALRTNPDRQDPAVVVLPVFVDAAGDLDEQVASSRWRHVYRALLALADHDSELAGELTRRSTSGGGSRAGGDAGHLVVLAADGSLGLDELHCALQLRALRLLTPRWDRGFAELEAYVERHGDARVPQDHLTATKFALGTWVRGNRRRRRELTPAQVDKLEGLAGWSWNLHETLWWEGFGRLRDYIAEHGHARIPSTYRGPDGFALHQWCSAQRTEIAAGRLPADREQALRDLTVFSLRPADARWDAGITALAVFVDAEGHASPVQRYVSPGGFRLGQWVHNVRRPELTSPPIRSARWRPFPGGLGIPRTACGAEALTNSPPIRLATGTFRCPVAMSAPAEPSSASGWTTRRRRCGPANSHLSADRHWPRLIRTGLHRRADACYLVPRVTPPY